MELESRSFRSTRGSQCNTLKETKEDQGLENETQASVCLLYMLCDLDITKPDFIFKGQDMAPSIGEPHPPKSVILFSFGNEKMTRLVS